MDTHRKLIIVIKQKGSGFREARVKWTTQQAHYYLWLRSRSLKKKLGHICSPGDEHDVPSVVRRRRWPSDVYRNSRSKDTVTPAWAMSPLPVLRPTVQRILCAPPCQRSTIQSPIHNLVLWNKVPGSTSLVSCAFKMTSQLLILLCH